MNSIYDLMSEMELSKPAKKDKLEMIEKKFNIVLPKQHIDFMLLHNGGEGNIGKYGYCLQDISRKIFFVNSLDLVNDIQIVSANIKLASYSISLI